MSFGVRLQYWLLRAGCWLVGILPTWFLYNVLLNVIYFVFYKVVGYRVGVVRENLSLSFPEKSPEELKEIERKYYKHLAELFVDTIDIASISEKEIRKRIEFLGIEEHEAQVRGRNWIAALAHFGSWEYFSAYQLFTSAQVVGAYRPLHNKAFDMFYRYIRSRFGLVSQPKNNILRYVVANADNPDRKIALGLIADQTPSGGETFYIFNFLNQPTSFYIGIEKIARKFKMPVYFMHLDKEAKIRYKARFEMIYDGEEQVGEYEITERYVRRLEQMICEKPWLWMWSHRRWKHTRGKKLTKAKLQ